MTRDRQTMRVLSLIIGGMLILMSQNVSAAATVAGRVILATGKATAVLAGKTDRVLKRGSNVFEGDTVKTDDKSYLKIKYTDGGFMMIRPSSQIVIEKYVPLEKGEGSQITNLVKGGMRVVTGAIGKANHDNVMVKSTPATIGIRGTDWTMRVCAADCVDLAQLGVPVPSNGLYTGVNFGSIAIQNQFGILITSQGQYAYVKGPNSKPTKLPNAPAILAVDAIPDPTKSNSQDFIKSSTCR